MKYSVPYLTPLVLLGALDLVCTMTPHIKYYEGELLVIHNVGIFFVTGYTAG